MNPLTREWIEKAEADLAAAEWLMRAPQPSYDAVCFHAQQCAEKYLKAQLQEAMLSFPKTHDLEKLIDLLLPRAPGLTALRSIAKALSEYAVEVRYPGESADAKTAGEALTQCANIRAEMRRELGLPA